MALTEKQRKENTKMMTIYISLVIGVLAAYFCSYACSMMYAEEGTFFDGVISAYTGIMSGKLLFPINQKTFIGIILGPLIGAASFFLISNDNERKYHYKDDEVGGTGGFMDQKEMKEYAEKYITKDPPPLKGIVPVASGREEDKKMYSQNMIMSNSFCRPIDSRTIMGNNNVMVVGGAGTGKSRGLVKPNLLQMNASYVITDPSGEMIYSLGKVLENHGYKILIFNISDMAHSNCYNPLNYIRDEAGVNMVIDCFVNNTTNGEGGGDNQFFVDAEKLLYSACIFYLKDFAYDDSKKNFSTIADMINKAKVASANGGKSPLDELFEALPTDSLAWKMYNSFQKAADKTLQSILISCLVRLRPFMTPQVANLTKTDNLHLERLGEEKTALFIITPQADRTYSFLSSMLYSQLFETLYYIGEQKKAKTGDERLKIPVRCIMDEFANIGEVPEFPSKLSTMRKYNISSMVVLQDIAQIEAMYKDNWKTLVGNCSTFIFLGTQEPNTLKYFSEMLGKMTIRTKSSGMSNGGKSGSNMNFQNTSREVMTADELGRMPADECIVFTQNMRPVRDKKYIYQSHPYYDQTADAHNDDEHAFKYIELSAYDATKIGMTESVVKSQALSKRVKAERERKAQRLKPVQNIQGFASPAAMLDRMSFGKDKDEAIAKAILGECRMAALECETNPICIMIRGIPVKLLQRMVRETYDVIQKGALIIITDLSTRGIDNMVCGLAYDPNKQGLEKALMKNEYVQDTVKDGEFLLFTIGKGDYNLFYESITNS